MSSYKDQLKQNLKSIQLKGARILSVGAEVDDRNYFNSVECEEFMTLDNNREFNPTINFDMNKPIVSDDIEIDEKYIDSFDTVLALNLWEYIYDPLTAHRNIMDLLTPGGLLITNYPFVYPMHNPAGIDYLRYTPEGVEKLLSICGFTVVKHEFIYGNSLLPDFYQSEGLKARSNFNHEIIGSIVVAKKG